LVIWKKNDHSYCVTLTAHSDPHTEGSILCIGCARCIW